MTDYPILVERYDDNQAIIVVCLDCGAEMEWNPDWGEPECTLHGNPTLRECGGQWTFKYVEADRCPGCGTLGFYGTELNKCCSRRCQLQAEYAAQLAERTA